MGGRAAAAAYYPLGLITAILRGMRNTADAEDKGDSQPPGLIAAMEVAGSVQDAPNASIMAAMKSQDLAKDIAQTELTVKIADGTQRKVRPSGNFKPQYKDEYTGELLPEPTRSSTLRNMSSLQFRLKRLGMTQLVKLVVRGG